jgi:hypothetical protein
MASLSRSCKRQICKIKKLYYHSLLCRGNQPIIVYNRARNKNLSLQILHELDEATCACFKSGSFLIKVTWWRFTFAPSYSNMISLHKKYIFTCPLTLNAGWSSTMYFLLVLIFLTSIFNLDDHLRLMSPSDDILNHTYSANSCMAPNPHRHNNSIMYGLIHKANTNYHTTKHCTPMWCIIYNCVLTIRVQSPYFILVKHSFIYFTIYDDL